MTCTARFLILATLSSLPSSAPAAAPRTAEQNYEKYCVGCHADNGKGQTRLGRKSGAKDLTDRNGVGKLTDTEIFRTIQLGRKDRQGREKMEAFGEDLSTAEINELVAFVRRFTR